MFFHLVVVLGACAVSTLAQADEKYLNDVILPLCFEHPTYSNDELYLNGQKEASANSLENFISLAEKLELANPDMRLQDELFILLKNYTAENVYYQHGDTVSLDVWDPSPAKAHKVNHLWEPNVEKPFPNVIDPFERNEKCSLFFMLSRSVNDTARPHIDPEYFKSSGVESSPENSQFSPQKTDIPREQGVVSISGSRIHAVALGRVLLGLYVGLKNKDSTNIDVLTLDGVTRSDFPNGERLDVLYAVTLADQLIYSQIPLTDISKRDFSQDGLWKSRPQDNGRAPICPKVYELPKNKTSAFTSSSVRGGVDGLILGEIIEQVYNAQQNIRLSQILRMYYSRSGLQENSQVSHAPISFCNRIDEIALKQEHLKKQMEVFLKVVYSQGNPEVQVSKSIKAFDEQKSTMMTEEIRKICDQQVDSSSYAGLECEATIDIIFVMDTQASDDNFEMQKDIIGHLANRLRSNMWHKGSTVTVFSDQRNTTSGLGLVTLISNTSSSASAACAATELKKDYNSATDKEFMVQSLNELLKNVENEEKALNGARGKVVIFFNFEETESLTYRLRTALRNLYMNHDGVLYLAIGNTKDVLKIYSQSQPQNAIVVTSLTPDERINTLAVKICEIPSKLQYDDCATGRNEAGAVYEGLISPNSLQRWAMHPKYFYKSFFSKIYFQAEDKPIEVCESRANSRADLQQSNCRKTSQTEKRIVFNTTNPCKAFSQYSCSPWFFTVRVAKEENSNQPSSQQYCQDTNNLMCKTLDQVKFRVSHDGVRCSSCSGLFATPTLLLACFALYILRKVFNVND